MELLYPRIARKEWPLLLSLSLQGALVAGLYGAINDQITYSISPEYFTRLKFEQFHYVDWGLPPRWRVGVIGFLAAWWVGFSASWLLTRIAIRRSPEAAIPFRIRKALALVLACAALFGGGGFLLGHFTLHGSTLAVWDGWRDGGVEDLRHFALVAYIHDATYLGAFLGTLLGILSLQRNQSDLLPPCLTKS